MTQDKKQELEQAMLAIKKNNNQENTAKLIKIMEKCVFFVPAVLPLDTDPRLIKQIVDSNGKEMVVPKSVSPRPAVLENQNKQRFFPLFTSEKQARKGKQQLPLMLTLPFQQCMEFITQDSSVSGFVLNAYDQNIILNVNITEKQKQEEKKVQLTEPQMHLFLRQKVEASIFPSALFEQKEELIDKLRKQEGEVLLSFYEDAYPEQLPCPYTAEDFDVMALNISDTLTILRITMPQEHQGAGICPVVLISWNPEEKSSRYFGIVRGKSGEPAHIIEALADGKKNDLGEAPEESTELQYIIDLCQ